MKLPKIPTIEPRSAEAVVGGLSICLGVYLLSHAWAAIVFGAMLIAPTVYTNVRGPR